MKVLSNRAAIKLGVFLLVAGLALAPATFAQYGGGGGMKPQPMPQQQPQQQPPTGAQQPPAQAPAEPPKTDPEEAAYKAFYDVKPDALSQQVQLGEQFVQKYPTSHYRETVYARLTVAYYTSQKYDQMYAAADKALSINPDDVNVLVLIGWVIPHNYDPNDLDAERQLDKAEKYETQSLTLMATLSKPTGMTDEQFEKTKTALTLQAHSGLGLVYFRRQQFEKSVKEFQQATQTSTQPDPVDYYVMGVELQQLSRSSEAADAFAKCGGISGGLQGRCKQLAEQTKKHAASQPAAQKP